MKQNVDVLNIIVTAFMSLVETIFGFSAEAVCEVGNSNQKGDL